MGKQETLSLQYLPSLFLPVRRSLIERHSMTGFPFVFQGESSFSFTGS
jgi:hypothetical protein